MASTKTLRARRKKFAMNQSDFWSRVGVTQSAGSRYESGRAVPKSVRMLLGIAYGTVSDRSKVLDQLSSHVK